MNQSLNQIYTPWKILRFALPSIVMMIFMSLYTIVDGIFVSRYVGSNALSSLNIVYPVMNILIAVAMMFATGGNAIISQQMGRGQLKKANQCLSQFVFIGLALSIVITIVTLCFLTPICYFLGSNDVLLADCRIYLKIVALFAPACMLQTLFQSYFATAGRPSLGMILTIGAGILNIVLDYLFIAVFHMDVAGAALATGIGQFMPAVVGGIYFFVTKGELHFTKFTFRLREIGMACYNGSSEMVSQLSGALVTFLFNIILIRLVGEHGVAAITILLYGQFLFNAFYIGLSIGISPIVGYQFGAKNKPRLKKIYNLSMIFVIISSIVIVLLSVFAATPIVAIFTDDPKTFQLAASGFKIFALNFLFSGVNIVASGFYTALSNGKISAIISFSRTFVFMVITLLTLPQIWGVTGVWISIPVAEFITLILCFVMHLRYFVVPGKQNYIKELS